MFPENLQNLHHATIIIGNRAENLILLKKYLNEQEIATEGNSDFFVFDADQMSMDFVRDEVIPFVSSKKVSDARFIVLSFDRTGSNEAQNALLKSIEEPQEGTYFFLLVTRADVLLPTILSRCQIVAGAAGAGDSRLSIADFLRASVSERFSLIEDWTKNKKDEDNLSKTEVVNFLDGLEKFLWEKENRDENLFGDIRQMRSYAHIRGASHRVILDFIAMVAPVLK